MIEQKTCPKCGDVFQCNSKNIEKCQCSAVKLSPEESDLVKSKFSDCLCVSCLEEIKNSYEK